MVECAKPVVGQEEKCGNMIAENFSRVSVAIFKSLLMLYLFVLVKLLSENCVTLWASFSRAIFVLIDAVNCSKYLFLSRFLSKSRFPLFGKRSRLLFYRIFLRKTGSLFCENYSKILFGILGLIFLGLLAGGALLGLIVQAGSLNEIHGIFSIFSQYFDLYLWRITYFTLLQALLSSLLSVTFAIFLARALYWSPHFPGRLWILRLFTLPLVLPALVAILGLTSIYGRNGIMAQLFQLLGLPFEVNIYGLTGILIAHIFFNMPLAVRFILAAYDTLPPDYSKLSCQIGMGRFGYWRFVEWPVLRRHLAALLGIIFMLCATSFTTVLTMGGGPKATTLEVAIYQSLHFDFDPNRTVALTLTQLALTLIILLALRLTGKFTAEGFSHKLIMRHYGKISAIEKMFNNLIILVGLLYILLPIIGMIIAGCNANMGRLLSDATVWRAITTSILLGFCAAAFASFLAFILLTARSATKKHAFLFDNGASLILVMPPIVIGAGWFILLRPFADPFAFAPIMVVSVNAVMAMPFIMKMIRPAWDSAHHRHHRLCAQLGLRGFWRFRLIDWPILAKPFSASFAFAMALSLGDLGTIALFGGDAFLTLPYLLFQNMGSYRSMDSAGLALILAFLCLCLMMVAGRTLAKEKLFT